MSTLETALRNLPQYISKSGLVGSDKHAAMQCFETLRDALGRPPAGAQHPDHIVDATKMVAQQQGQAVAWHTDDHLSDKSATTYDPVVRDRWIAKGWPVVPLYAAPQPMQQGSGPSAYCLVCEGVGMRNCAHFNECAGATCITCHRPLNAAPPSAPVETSLSDWSLRMAAKEAGQHVGAGAHGFEDRPERCQHGVRNPHPCRECEDGPSAPVEVEGLMQLARNWCLAWGEWAHDADPGCVKENAAEAALRAALTTALAQQPAASMRCDDCHEPTGPRAVCETCAGIRSDAVSQQPAAVDEAMDKARFKRAPCYLCGYNGPGYYQPDTHPCAAKYHATQHQEPTT